MERLKEKFSGSNKCKVMLIFDVWKEKGTTCRTQVRLPYMNIEEVIEKYGDFIYSGWYTEGWEPETGRIIASLWAYADDKHRIDPDLYENWPKLWEGDDTK